MLVEIDYEITVEGGATGMCEKEFKDCLITRLTRFLEREVYVHNAKKQFVATLDLKSIKVNLAHER